METLLNWKTKLFSKRYDIYNHTELTGRLNKMSWSKKVAGELNGREILFETKGFFRQETRIMDVLNNPVIGTIIYKSWRSRAVISYQDKEYNWQFDNFWRTKWSIQNRNGVIIRYKSNRFRGTINSYTNEEVLILAGFFVRNLMNERASHAAATS